MMLKGKVLGSLLVLWFIFLTLLLWHASFYYIVLLSSAFLIVQLALIYLIGIKPIEKLLTAMTKINREHDYTKRLITRGNDELSTLSAEINTILELAQAAEERTHLRIQARTLKLDKKIDDLKKDVNNLESVKDQILSHNKKLVHMMQFDALTELPNRVFFNEILNEKIKYSQQHNKKLALLIINLDNFKNINDTVGHITGDLLLKEINARFKKLIRATDTLARTGGAEFSILLDDIVHPEIAGLFAEKIIETFSADFQIEKKIIRLIISIGICIFPRDGITLEKLLKNADTAMFKAKAAGGGTYHYFMSDMNVEITKLNKLGVALQNAINKNEFVLYYQPKINLKNGKIVGVEALLRWESPILGLITPSRFIPLAEETGIIIQLGEWVLREACRHNKSWQKQGFHSLPMSINLSPYQFKHQDLSGLIAQTLKEAELKPAFLELEINSSDIMDNLPIATKILQSIKSMGVRTVIDKFGTGNISVSSLKTLPIDSLKIDSKFIKEIPTNPDNLGLVNALIDLAHDLKYEIIATGIENTQQLEYLVNRNCTTGQGYFFSKPLPEFSFMSSFFYGNTSA